MTEFWTEQSVLGATTTGEVATTGVDATTGEANAAVATAGDAIKREATLGDEVNTEGLDTRPGEKTDGL